MSDPLKSPLQADQDQPPPTEDQPPPPPAGEDQSSPDEELPPIDISSPDTSGEGVKGQEVPLHTLDWAKVVKPFSLFILSLIAAVILIPFVFFVLPYPTGVYMTQALDWAKTVLAPVVGFGGAVVGYYFGARSSSNQ